MKLPPLLLGTALLFWGWQADLLVVGAALAAVAECPRLFAGRWEFSADDFRRVWAFCLLAMLAVLLYAFNESDGQAALAKMAESPGRYGSQHALTNAASTTASLGLRWAPMVFFLFAATRLFSSREKVPLAVASPLFWRSVPEPQPPADQFTLPRQFDPVWPYFFLCLLSASQHPAEVHPFFWGYAGLVAWALWALRSPRFALPVWLLAVVAAVGLGYGGQFGIGSFQQWFARINSAWLADMMARRFSDADKTQTRIGKIGRLAQSGRIVIRLRTPPGQSPPPLLHEASYTAFRRDEWLAGKGAGFNEVTEQSDVTTWELLPRKQATATVNIASYLARQRDLLPLPTGVARLEHLDMDVVRTNGLGAVQAEGRGLAMFDAAYGPGLTIDAPPNPNSDMLLPNEETNTLAAIVAELKLNELSDPQKLATLQQYFSDKYTYSLWQDEPRNPRRSALGRFLRETHRGHCEYFATATVLLLRQAGVPARYAVGYSVHEQAGTDKYVVRLRDGHAWCQVWNRAQHIWEDFDTTPGDRLKEQEARQGSWFQPVSDLWDWVWFEFARFRWSQANWRQYLMWGLLPVLGVLLFQIVRQAQRRSAQRRTRAQLRNDWPGLDSEFYQLAERLTAFIGPRAPEETPAHWLERAAAQPQLATLEGSLREILALHYKLRFDPHGLDAEARGRLRQAAADCLLRLRPAAS